IEKYKNSDRPDNEERRKKVVSLFSKKLASKKKTHLNKEEMHNLIDQLFASKNPNYSPDGQKIIALIETEDFNSFFK
ncbi:MAG: hypothetical protein EAY69_10815, partial [Cytophagales bacterium]